MKRMCKRDPEVLAASRRLGLTTTAIQIRIRKWGRERALATPKVTRAIAWERASWERTDEEIAAELGIHRVTVYKQRLALGIKRPPSRRAWTEAQENLLAELYWSDWTDEGRARLARELGRTVGALRRQATVLRLSERVRAVAAERWPKTIDQLARETGYDRWRLLQAARRARVRLRRGGVRADAYAISERQAERLIAELRAFPDGANMHVRRCKEWRPGQKCRVCGTTRLPRMAREKCSGCYMRAIRAKKRTATEAAA